MSDEHADTAALERDWYHPDLTTFGDRLSGARTAAGYTQAQLAENLGVKLKTIRAWEEDRAEPRANRVSMLSGVLNVSLVWLMTGTGEGPAVTLSTEQTDDELLGEVARLRREAARLTDRLALLEGRLRSRLGDEA
ncbi:helix-turn-helix domain-containing protein [Jannaschia ovalis]|uniref:Helix-turn-helix transcriptional regulator n=1 Tax=Jannaschia ovalis TaxID=3038773 RepID=A0ABY8LCS8_9RHOB|nr:helix-turn-helix transcriptional regulator [Jannaschia sp. GRR-S6-38]WGH78090.1 helix-turn-helix transcriptional regulator [Jannaschia sp. GRR-S6-38]